MAQKQYIVGRYVWFWRPRRRANATYAQLRFKTCAKNTYIVGALTLKAKHILQAGKKPFEVTAQKNNISRVPNERNLIPIPAVIITNWSSGPH